MVESYEYGGNRSLISLGQMLREILQEIDFVGDLGYAEIGQRQRRRGAECLCAYNDVRLDLGRDDRVFPYPISWG